MTPTSGREAWGDATDALADTGGPQPEALVRRRRRAIAAVVVAGLVAAGAGAALAQTTGVDFGGSADVPAVQVVGGLVLAGAGLVVQFIGLRRQRRANRGTSPWRGPLLALSRSQRKQLAEQVRGRRPVEPGTEDLTAHTARTMVQQRAAVLGTTGLSALWVGLWIASPSTWRSLLAGAFVLMVAVTAVFVERDARAGQRFLAGRRGT